MKLLTFLFHRLHTFSGVFLVILLSLMIIDVSWQVLTRFFTDKPSSFTEEVARFLLIWISLLGASFTHARRAHLGIDLLVNSLQANKKRIVSSVSHLASFVFAASVMVYGGSYLVHLTFNLKQVSASLGIPMAYVYLIIPISGSIICVNAMYFAMLELKPDSK